MRFDTLQEWLDWQAGLHPREIELGLERTRAVWHRLHGGDPYPCRVITVAGTNGKGSCVAFLEAILREAGYRVGAYTSPHLVRYNERIRIAGSEADDLAICTAFDRVDQARGETPLTYFEFGTLAALELFAATELEIVILEVGLGGRLDAVNILDPDVALITTIDIDHTDWLGETREQIGWEKAGIMRAGAPAVFAGDDPPASLLGRAEELGVALSLYGRDYSIRMEEGAWYWQGGGITRNALPLPGLRGGYQLRNAAAALMVLACLEREFPVSQAAARNGLLSASLPGRFQVMVGEPTIILDVAHNPQAARSLAENLGDFFCPGRTLAVFSMLSDKDIPGVATIMNPRVDHWHLGGLDLPRALPVEELRGRLVESGVSEERITTHPTIAAAFASARESATSGDRLLGFGSFHVVGEILELL